MKIVIEVPDELAPVVLKILENKDFPDDDGRSDAHIMNELELTVDQYVAASNLADAFEDQLYEYCKRTL